MKRFSIFLIFFLCLQNAFAADESKTIKTGANVVTELWQGKVLTASFRTGMCFYPDGKAQGVLILRHANGKEDTYHLYGSIKQNSFELSHGSGHIFKGQLTGSDTMVGTVKLKNGLRLSLDGKRIKDAELLAKDCAPLD